MAFKTCRRYHRRPVDLRATLALAVCFSGVSAEGLRAIWDGHAGGNLGLIVQDRSGNRYTYTGPPPPGCRRAMTALAPWQYTSQKPWDVPWSNPAIELVKRIQRERQ